MGGGALSTGTKQWGASEGCRARECLGAGLVRGHVVGEAGNPCEPGLWSWRQEGALRTLRASSQMDHEETGQRMRCVRRGPRGDMGALNLGIWSCRGVEARGLCPQECGEARGRAEPTQERKPESEGDWASPGSLAPYCPVCPWAEQGRALQ